MEKHYTATPALQKRNWCLTAAITLFLLLTYYGLSIPQTVRSIMSSLPAASPEIPIKVTISYTPPSTTPTKLTFKVKVENTSPTQPIYILNWSSPLDPHAAALGVFTFASRSGQEAPGTGLKINHKMPDNGYFDVNDEEVLKIEAGGNIERSVEVKEHEVVLEKGDEYVVQAKGRWMGIWVGEHERLGFKKGSDFLIGEFESESIEIRTMP